MNNLLEMLFFSQKIFCILSSLWISPTFTVFLSLKSADSNLLAVNPRNYNNDWPGKIRPTMALTTVLLELRSAQ